MYHNHCHMVAQASYPDQDLAEPAAAPACAADLRLVRAALSNPEQSAVRLFLSFQFASA